MNVYEILNGFVAYLSKKSNAIQSLRLYFNAFKSYFEFNDIDIVPNKFRKRVKMPKYYPEPGEPLTISDIREMLNQCRNERLALGQDSKDIYRLSFRFFRGFRRVVSINIFKSCLFFNFRHWMIEKGRFKLEIAL